MKPAALPAMLETTALAISTSRLKRHLFLLTLAFISITFIGYHFGTFDQSIHIPNLKATADPSLYPNDPFIALRTEKYSYFWLIFIPFYKLGILEETLFVVHIISTYFTFWMVYKLAQTLFKTPMSAMFGAAAFLFPHISFSGFPLIEFSLLNRTVVFPFLILCIHLYLRGIRARSFFILGILYNLHVLSVNFVLAMFALDFILEYRRIGWRKIINCLVVFVIAALPVLLWKLQGSGTEIELQPAWLDLISRTMVMHLFYLLGPIYVWVPGVSALSAYGLLFIAYRAKEKTALDHTVLIFVLAVTSIVLVQVIVSAWLPINFILQLQIMRAGIFAVFFAYLYFADYLARKWQAGGVRSPGDGIVTVTFFLSTLTFITVLVIAAQRWWSATPQKLRAASVTLVFGFIALMVMTITGNLWRPGIYVYGNDNPWRDAQEWAQQNTAKEAIFITPLNKWWLFESEWRVYSERQNVTSIYEVMEAAFVPEYVSHWQPRFETLAPGALDQFRGNFSENQRIAGAMYNSLSTRELLNAACEYHAGYIVVEASHAHPSLSEVYANPEYRIYDVRNNACNLEIRFSR